MLNNETPHEAPQDQVVTDDTSDQVFIPETTEQAEELYNRAMAGETTNEIPAEASQQPAGETTTDETHKINWNGEERELPLNKILEYAQQGYDYNFKMRDLNKSQDDFKTQQQQFQEQQAALKEYQEVQEWAKANPDLWNHAVQSFRQAQSGQTNTQEQGSADFSPQAMSVINGLNDKITQLESKFGKIEEVTQTQQQQAEDDALDAQIKGVMNKYPDWDWATRDENGHTLEDRTTQYAINNGISDFEAAFKTAHYDQLIERAKLSAKEELGKTVAKQAKVPTNGVKPGLTNATDIRTKSYEDLTREALEELGISDS
jgi:hypothetical protein